MKNLKTLLFDEKFCIDYDVNESIVTHKFNKGSYHFIFNVGYDKSFKWSVVPDENGQEDYNVEFTPIDIHDVELYINDTTYEFTDNELEDIKDYTFKRLTQ